MNMALCKLTWFTYFKVKTNWDRKVMQFHALNYGNKTILIFGWSFKWVKWLLKCWKSRSNSSPTIDFLKFFIVNIGALKG